MLKHGVPRIILQKRTTIIGFDEFGKYIWNSSGKSHLSLSNPKPQIAEAEKLSSSDSTGARPVIKLTNPQGFSAEIFSNVSAELLQLFIKGFCHAE